jgi:hypothetical protein
MLVNSKQISVCNFFVLVFTFQIVINVLSFAFSALFLYLKTSVSPLVITPNFNLNKSVYSLLIYTYSIFTFFNGMPSLIFPLLRSALYSFFIIETSTLLFFHRLQIFVPHSTTSFLFFH